MGGSDPQQMKIEAQDLAVVLRMGALPAPLALESVSKLPQ